MRGSRGWLSTGIILLIAGAIVLIIGIVTNGKIVFGELEGGGYGYGYIDGVPEIVWGIILLCGGAVIFIVRAALANKAKQAAISQDNAQRQSQESGAAQGDPKSLFLMGTRYYSGNGVAKDLSKAFSSFKEAADSGHVSAMTELAGLYERGEGTAQNDKAALDWYKKAELKGDKKASVKVGEFLRDGKGGLSVNVKEAFNRFKEAAGAGAPLAYYNLALAYLNGTGCEKDLTLAKSYMNRAAQADVPGAAQRLEGMMNLSGQSPSAPANDVGSAGSTGSAPEAAAEDKSESYVSPDDVDGNTVLMDDEDEKTVLINRCEPALVSVNDGKETAVAGDTFTMGRSKQKCDFVIDSPSVSGAHACITRSDGKIFIKDLGSSNHTYVNGKQIDGTPVQLNDGDCIRLAKEEFKVIVK